MKKIIFALIILSASPSFAARSQAECPPDTIWNSSTNKCYEDPNSPASQERQQRGIEAWQRERALAEQRRHNQEMEEAARDANRRDYRPSVIVNPPPIIITR